jgi:DNA-binding NtrC family response regulator
MLTHSHESLKGATRPEPNVDSRDFPQAAKKSALGRVLVVDDEALVRWSVAETLMDRGYEVTEAHDAASALRQFSMPLGATDLVLLDLRLPDSDDLHVLSAMHRLAPTTPVILMTAYGTPEIFDRARQLGAFTVVNKPFEMNELAPLVERALAARPH